MRRTSKREGVGFHAGFANWCIGKSAHVDLSADVELADAIRVVGFVLTSLIKKCVCASHQAGSRWTHLHHRGWWFGDANPRRAVVPPPRLRASPIAFDADDASRPMPGRLRLARDPGRVSDDAD